MTERDIERADRLGRYGPVRKQPIAVKFMAFRQKEAILSMRHKLEGTRFAVSGDYSKDVQIAHGHLLVFPTAERCRYNLRRDKLYIDDKCHTFDPKQNEVTLLSS